MVHYVDSAAMVAANNQWESRMKVDLRDLKPNPMRDFAVDPLDKEQVAKLKKSIEDYGFWEGVTGRKTKNGIEVAAGWHRVKAAIASNKVEQANIFLGDFDDKDMAIIYATENATQRGNTSTAVAGSVASAVRFLAKAVMTGTSEEFFGGSRGLETVRGQMTTDRGIGRDVIVRLLHNVPGINDGSVQQQLANLRKSGDYARIMKEVQKEIAKETDDPNILALAKLATEAVKDEKTFDFKGTAEHLKNPHQVDTFRKVVTGPGIAPYLSVENQGELAAAIVDAADEQGRELTGAFIREEAARQTLGIQTTKRTLNKEEREALAKEDWESRAKEYQDNFAGSIRSALAALIRLRDHCKERPRGVALHRTGQFNTAEANLKKMLQLLERL